MLNSHAMIFNRCRNAILGGIVRDCAGSLYDFRQTFFKILNRPFFRRERKCCYIMAYMFYPHAIFNIDMFLDTFNFRMKFLVCILYGYTLVDNLDLADRVREKAEEVGIELSNYCMPAIVVQDTEEELHAEIERIKEHVDVVNRMGIKHIRHDVTAFTLPPEKRTIQYFEESLPKIVQGTRAVADYAAQYGITTSVENHGMAVQHSDRVQRVIQAVNRDNFKTTLDTGNFLCVDEDPVVGVKKNLP